MTPRPKTGGRKKGTPNKRTFLVVERLEAMGCDPIEGMARIAMDEAAPLEIRARMYAELAQYVHPKRKPLEQTEGDSGIRIVLNIGQSQGRVIEHEDTSPQIAH